MMKIILCISLLLSTSVVYSMDCSQIHSPVTQAFCEANNRRAEEINERGSQSIARVCATNYGVCQLSYLVAKGNRCGCRAAYGRIIPGITR